MIPIHFIDVAYLEEYHEEVVELAVQIAHHGECLRAFGDGQLLDVGLLLQHSPRLMQNT